MDGKLITSFIDAYGVDAYSPAGIEYQKFMKPYLEKALLHADANYSIFLYKEYENIRSEYMKSMICLVLGLRGAKEMMPMLMQEARRMSLHYPGELLYQGPVIGAMELGARYYGTERSI